MGLCVCVCVHGGVTWAQSTCWDVCVCVLRVREGGARCVHPPTHTHSGSAFTHTHARCALQQAYSYRGRERGRRERGAAEGACEEGAGEMAQKTGYRGGRVRACADVCVVCYVWCAYSSAVRYMGGCVRAERAKGDVAAARGGAARLRAGVYGTAAAAATAAAGSAAAAGKRQGAARRRSGGARGRGRRPPGERALWLAAAAPPPPLPAAAPPLTGSADTARWSVAS